MMIIMMMIDFSLIIIEVLSRVYDVYGTAVFRIYHGPLWEELSSSGRRHIRFWDCENAVWWDNWQWVYTMKLKSALNEHHLRKSRWSWNGDDTTYCSKYLILWQNQFLTTKTPCQWESSVRNQKYLNTKLSVVQGLDPQASQTRKKDRTRRTQLLLPDSHAWACSDGDRDSLGRGTILWQDFHAARPRQTASKESATVGTSAFQHSSVARFLH